MSIDKVKFYYIPKVRQHCPSNTPIVLVNTSNKFNWNSTDERKSTFDNKKDKIILLAKQNHDDTYIECSYMGKYF
jgi:hypothetical protein